MQATKQCPYCAEEIRAEARRCRYCRSRLLSFESAQWHRSHPEARIAGVCAALAHMLAMPVSVVRLGFIVFTLVLHLAPLAYLALWLVIPQKPGGASNLEWMLQSALDFAGMLRAQRRSDHDVEVQTPAPRGRHDEVSGDTPPAAHLLS